MKNVTIIAAGIRKPS